MITSVLITLYNYEKYISCALNSILSSNTKNIQLIISDDCSQDNSYLVAKRWIDNHKHLFASALIFKQPNNLGMNGNINFLVSKASGDFITFLDADDAFVASAIDINAQYLIDHPKIDFLFSNHRLIDELNDVYDWRYVQPARALAIKYKFFIILDVVFNWGIPWSKVFARIDSFKNLGSLPKSISFNDRWTAFKILQVGNFAYFDNMSFLYRTRFDKSPTPSCTKKQMLDDLLEVELDALNSSKGLLFIFLYFHLLPLKIKSKNRLIISLSKLPKKIIRKLYRSII
ncbi:glycosyltransferase family A protein [Candidatus Methylopumilus universalis]|jgi:glycosyltransferase involved in cell wall biosynthesis|uniref:glycosyltransferase family A protein n=1 Tax=Candidatus Methylopumilus universalis TaxID=2588536 RepID=UPI00111EF1F5|nr:glycosyltransferase family 2 protein [Candidatus Methylopumilus universalis]QDC79094.1 glycosyltransferase family 2 protein [Candidatus Methylopumilus universalis]